MLYVARYQGNFSSRREELLRQRSLAEELLGWSLQNEYGLQLSSLSRGRTSSGKPFFLDCPLHFSLSHTRGMVCCALSAFPVGVDVEGLRPIREALVRRVCTEEEYAWLAAQKDRDAAFLSLWTLKESVMKLSGHGLGYGLRRAAFSMEDAGPHFCGPGVRLSQFSLTGGYVVSAASEGEAFSEPRFVTL